MFNYGFRTGIPLNILIIYGKDPNLIKTLFTQSKIIHIAG